MIKLTDREFTDIVNFVKQNYGINLSQKRQLIESRMASVLAEKNLSSFSEYFNLIKQKNSGELTAMINKLTTNHTFFMREPAHFDFMKNTILPKFSTNNPSKELRIWSAGCSSGEEAYTTVMVMKEFLGAGASSWDTRILATDISEKVMAKAKEGIYPGESLKDVSTAWKTKYFVQKDTENFALRPEIRAEVIFKYLNLMEPFPPFKKPFDLIFCRNVMIYFDQETKNKLINKFYDALRPGGYFFIGHSETVQRDKSNFEYIQPSIYRKGV